MLIGPFSCVLTPWGTALHILYALLTNQSRRGPTAPATSHVEDGTFFTKFPFTCLLWPLASLLMPLLCHSLCTLCWPISCLTVWSSYDLRVAQAHHCLHCIYIWFSYSNTLINLGKVVPATVSLSLGLNVLLTTSSITFGNPVKYLQGFQVPSFQRAFDWFHFIILSLSWPQSIREA